MNRQGEGTIPATESPPDLPKIGAPAARALAEAGITCLDQLPQYRAADLLQLHGVGQKAIQTLREALAKRGLAFAAED